MLGKIKCKVFCNNTSVVIAEDENGQSRLQYKSDFKFTQPNDYLKCKEFSVLHKEASFEPGFYYWAYVDRHSMNVEIINKIKHTKRTT